MPSRLPLVAATVIVSLLAVAMTRLATAPEPPATGHASHESPPSVPPKSQAPGPIVLYQQRVAAGGRLQLVAVDLSREPLRPFVLGTIDDDTGQSAFVQHSAELVSVRVDDNVVALLGRGDTLDSRRVAVDGWLRAAAVSPDARRVAIAATPDDQAGIVSVYRTASLRARPVRARFQTSSDLSGGELQVFWSDDDSIVAIDVCHCDGGAGYAKAFSIEGDAQIAPLSLLDDIQPGYWFGAQMGGRRAVLATWPLVDCFTSEDACDDLEVSLTVADWARRSLTRIARVAGDTFESPQISPGGKLIAAATAGRINVYEARSGKIVATSRYESATLHPVAWLDDARLLAVATSPDYVGERQTGRLLRIDVRGGEEHAEPVPLASGIELQYVGWLR